MSKKTTEENKKGVPAFSEEQIKILKTAFDVTWARIKRFQEYVDGDATRQAALMKILHSKGAITCKDIAEIDWIYTEASSLVKGEWAVLESLPDTMEFILRGDMLGFTLTPGPLKMVTPACSDEA